MNITILSMKLLESRENLVELTINTGTQMLHNMLLRAWKQIFPDTSEVYTTGTLSETSLHLTLLETLTMLNSESNLDSLFLDSGKLTGVKDIVCQLDNTYSKTPNLLPNIFSISLSFMILMISLLKTSLLRWSYLKVLQTLR